MNTSLEEYVDLAEASAILDLSESYVRTILFEPDNVRISPAGQVCHLYSRARVEMIKEKRIARQRIRLENRGKRSCYYCRQKYNEKELCGGICPSCYARKTVRNFACFNDCFKHGLDKERLRLLRDTVDYFLSTLDNGN